MGGRFIFGLVSVFVLKELPNLSCAGANGFSKRTLLGTPRDGPRPTAAPVM
jgi:hypothetical protein